MNSVTSIQHQAKHVKKTPGIPENAPSSPYGKLKRPCPRLPLPLDWGKIGVTILPIRKREWDMILSDEEFSDLIEEALEDLPPFFRDKMNNVAILTAPWPTREELRSVGVPPGDTLLGLYQGIPLTERTQGYNMVAPDTITLYQGPIEVEANGDRDEIRAWVRHVFLHELAHHFGISDDRLRELGAY